MIRYCRQSIVSVGLRVLGLITKPYETYRDIVDRARYGELVAIGTFVATYFFIASIVKTSLFRPFLLTKQWIMLMGGAALMFVIVISLFWFVTGFLGRKGTIKGFVLSWGYTLVPTITWFWMTSLLFVLLPPPRTDGTLGIIFSALYLIISTTLLFWKVTLAYLALRFGLRLDLGKILLASIVVLPILAICSISLYRVGIFKIPFI